MNTHSQTDKGLGSSPYLKGDDETQSDGEELPVEEGIISTVVSEGFISTT